MNGYGSVRRVVGISNVTREVCDSEKKTQLIITVKQSRKAPPSL